MSDCDSNLLILVVEDNIIIQQTILAILHKLKYKAQLVADGLEAVEAFGEQKYNLILMDCQMPRMNGFEATQAIRELEGSAEHTPIIALTSAASLYSKEFCLQSGMDDYLTKPVSSELLDQTIRRWL